MGYWHVHKRDIEMARKLMDLLWTFDTVDAVYCTVQWIYCTVEYMLYIKMQTTTIAPPHMHILEVWYENDVVIIVIASSGVCTINLCIGLCVQ